MSTALRLEGVGKRYASYRSNLHRFATWFGADIAPVAEHWAVRDVSFSLKSGQAMALIGSNGAGKSTLLKLVTGTVRATTGVIDVNGRVSSILELGIGFNPELTGRENTLQTGGLLGYSSAEIESLLPTIENFAELGDFFEKPLRIYSSGMQARLAFALATATRPDILIVDEVLSVGDAYFQHKSFNRILQFKREGSAILLVTHSVGDLRTLCDRVILLEHGIVKKDGLPDEVIDYYNALIAQKELEHEAIEQKRGANGWLQTKSGIGTARTVKITLSDAGTGDRVETALVGQDLLLRVEAQAMGDIDKLVLGVMVRDRTGHLVWGTNTAHTRQTVVDLKAGDCVVYEWRFRCDLGQGSYGVTCALSSSETHLQHNYEWTDNVLVLEVINAGDVAFIGTGRLTPDFRITGPVRASD